MHTLISPLGVTLNANTQDTKLVVSKRNPMALLRCAATYRPIATTCRASECALHPDRPDSKGRKCYAVKNNVAFVNRRMEGLATASGATALQVTRAEAALVRGFAEAQTRRSGLDLRLGISGEASGPKGARALGDAAVHWRRQVGGSVWGYTHAWRRIARRSWGPAISVLASCDSSADVALAKRRGYVPAVVVANHPDTRPFTLDDDPTGTRFIRCPNETIGMACVECRLCLDDQRLRERNMGIAFAFTKRKLPLMPDSRRCGRDPTNSALHPASLARRAGRARRHRTRGGAGGHLRRRTRRRRRGDRAGARRVPGPSARSREGA